MEENPFDASYQQAITFIPDGEEPPAGFERIPQMLPIDKHIAETSEKQESENEE